MSVGELVARARALAGSGSRRLLGITGAPGAGKSTLCAALLDALGTDAVLIGMDGFHPANAELIRLGRRDRKGAPDTFDVDGYVALLRRLREQSTGVIYAPVFDGGLEESTPILEAGGLTRSIGTVRALNGAEFGRSPRFSPDRRRSPRRKGVCG